MGERVTPLVATITFLREVEKQAGATERICFTADQLRALREGVESGAEVVAALDEELAGADARERKLVRHRIACMRAQRDALQRRVVARLDRSLEAQIVAVFAEFEAESDEPRTEAALAAAEAGTPAERTEP